MTTRRQGEAPGRAFPIAFFERETEDVARDLLGAVLRRRDGRGGERVAVVVETEAYLGTRDRAAHTWDGRRTPRVEPMWGPAGRAYVYLVYGLHTCLNVVTRRAGDPQAVLIRAAVPIAWWRGEETTREETLAMSGPGRLCRTLGIGLGLSGSSLRGRHLRLEPGPPRAFETLRGPRVGVAYAGDAAGWPLRFAVAGCPAVTERRSLAADRGRTRLR